MGKLGFRVAVKALTGFYSQMSLIYVVLFKKLGYSLL